MAATLEQPKKLAGGAFGRFMAEKRPDFIKQCPGKPVSEVQKVASAAWKELSEAQKAPYQKKYEAAKAQYAIDFEAFIKAGGIIQKGAAALRAEKKKAQAGGKKSKANKDPNRPKKPAGGAFGCFLNKNRPAFVKECPGQSITGVSKHASAKWKAMTEGDKSVYEKEYQAKKAAYEKAMLTYVPPAGADDAEEGEDGEEGEEGDEDEEDEDGEEKEAEDSAVPAKKARTDEKVPSKAASNPADAEAIAQATKEGFGRQFKTLMELDKIQAKKLSAGAVLKALQDAKGKMVPAKHALLGA